MVCVSIEVACSRAKVLLDVGGEGVIPNWPEGKLKSSKRWLLGEIKKVDARLRLNIPKHRPLLSQYRKALETSLKNVEMLLKKH